MFRVLVMNGLTPLIDRLCRRCRWGLACVGYPEALRKETAAGGRLRAVRCCLAATNAALDPRIEVHKASEADQSGGRSAACLPSFRTSSPCGSQRPRRRNGTAPYSDTTDDQTVGGVKSWESGLPTRSSGGRVDAAFSSWSGYDVVSSSETRGSATDKDASTQPVTGAPVGQLSLVGLAPPKSRHRLTIVPSAGENVSSTAVVQAMTTTCRNEGPTRERAIAMAQP